jgi:hypothetical protein
MTTVDATDPRLIQMSLHILLSTSLSGRLATAKPNACHDVD